MDIKGSFFQVLRKCSLQNYCEMSAALIRETVAALESLQEPEN